jgi:hypothetical protein
MGIGDYLRIRDNFLAKAITGYGATVSRTPVTKTISGNFGDEILTEGTSANLTCFIVRKGTKWFVDNAGEFEKADALMLVKHDATINKNDIITYLTNKYRVESVLNRTAGEGQVVYKVCPLYLIE